MERIGVADAGETAQKPSCSSATALDQCADAAAIIGLAGGLPRCSRGKPSVQPRYQLVIGVTASE